MRLRFWQERAVAVVDGLQPARVEKKVFQPKFNLPVLADYKGDPGEDFWNMFPKNNEMWGTSSISADRLMKRVAAVGTSDGERLKVVCGDLRAGADIGCEGGCRRASKSTNAPSAYEYPAQVTDAVASWVSKGFVYGPVAAEDVPAVAKVNGIMCRPKPNGSVRIILNMSSPEGNCVNEGIDNSKFPAKMSSTKKWLKVINKAGRGALMAKLDWSDAYKHVRVRKEDINLQWFSWLGLFFVELCLIFGTVSSVGIYDRLAKVVLELVLRMSGFPAELVCQHLDDVCAAAAAGSPQLGVFVAMYRKVAADIGVMLAPEGDPDKAFAPCTAGVVLGVFYNTEEWIWSIPGEKVERLVHQIQAALSAEELRQDEIWSLAGRIFHYAPLVPEGRFNLNYIVAANGVSTDRRHMVVMGDKLKRQLYFWLVMLRVSTGLTMIPDLDQRAPAWTRECYTDAAGGSMDGSGRGTGCVSQDWWAVVPWGVRINCGAVAVDGGKLGRKLSALELVGPLICVAAGNGWCRNRPVRIWVDNAGSVLIWEKGYSNSCALCTTLVKAIAAVAAGIGCQLYIQKIRRCSSPGAVMADAISKADFNLFRRTALEHRWPLAVGPARVPGTLLRWIDRPVVSDSLGHEILDELAGGWSA